MKFLAVSLSALLTTLVYSSSAATTTPVSTYFFSHGRPSNSEILSHSADTPSLNLEETQAALEHLLNLGQSSHNTQSGNIDLNGPIQFVFNKHGKSRKDLFETIGGNLLMVIEGVRDAKDLLPSFEPAFTIDSTKGIQDMITELGSTVPSQNRYHFNTHKSSLSGDALVNEHLVAEHHANVDVSVFDLEKKADALFLEESVSLGNYIDSYVKSHNNKGQDFIRITIKGLNAIAVEHGLDSIQYTTAQQILKEFLQSTFIPEFEEIHKTYTATIFLVEPYSNNLGSELFKRSDVNAQTLKKRALPVALSGACYATEADCQTDTNSCSAHGTCILSVAANCYHCKCSSVNTTQYGGPSCEKIDISVQFHLFFWLVLVLVGLVTFAVVMIVSMGSNTQGGVPVGPTRQQLKRD